jgi:hypothetical protein
MVWYDVITDEHQLERYTGGSDVGLVDSVAEENHKNIQ